MQVDPSIFKSYDIRGIYGQNLFDDVAEAIGKAFVKVLDAKQVIVGRDARVSGPALHEKLLRGLTSLGTNVIDIGMVSTDMYYYACPLKKLPAIIITSTPHPKKNNSFKI